jgi:hypothetical protein
VTRLPVSLTTLSSFLYMSMCLSMSLHCIKHKYCVPHMHSCQYTHIHIAPIQYSDTAYVSCFFIIMVIPTLTVSVENKGTVFNSWGHTITQKLAQNIHTVFILQTTGMFCQQILGNFYFNFSVNL